jgi:arginyl-tRNA synthetase
MSAGDLPVQRELSGLFRQALARAAAAGALALDPDAIPEPALERPRLAEHGDWATNVAMVLAKAAKAAPRAVAEAMVAHLEAPDWVERVEVAGPGFVNVRLAHRWFEGLVRRVLATGGDFGRVELEDGARVNVEFISANPTGPLTVGNARGAALGDSLANVLEATGHRVQREYYFNDANAQIDLFGASVEAAYLARLGRPAQPPENGYKGAYVDELAAGLQQERGATLAELDQVERRKLVTEWAVRRMLAAIRQTVERFGVHFDVWFSEQTLHASGAIDAAVGRLRELGVVDDHEGAVWLRSTDFGDDKDRPLVRSTGAPTYFGADAAYYLDKRRRADRLLFVLGADHHGYAPRMRALARAFGDPDGTAEILLYQLVSLVSGGEPARMSKRAGDFVTVDDLLDEVGKDAARYEMLRYAPDTPIEFDIEAVRRQSMDNPVYYVQYAHARIASLVRQAVEVGFTAVPPEDADLGLLDHPTEGVLLRRLAGYEELVVLASRQRAPHRLTRYAEELAAAFHRFYGECRVLTDDPALSSARWWLCMATRQVLANTLGILGVTAPERM